VVAAEDAKRGSVHPSPSAAVDRASVVTLTYLYPAEAAALEAMRVARLAAPDWPGDAHMDVASGDAVGRAVGDAAVARVMTDRFFDPWTGTVPTGPGIWFSAAPPLGAMFGQARTYFLTSGAQFRPGPPPAFGSASFLTALAEVRRISDTRTPAQIASAQFWALQGGTVTPPGYWNDEGATLAVKYHLNERDAAHALAMVNMVGYDAIVACHDAKFTYWMLRPTMADPQITLAPGVGLPNFPSYPSDHACVSGAQTTVLGAVFPAERARLDELAGEAAVSRLYAGLHYRFDNETGLKLGRNVAAYAIAHDVKGHDSFLP